MPKFPNFSSFNQFLESFSFSDDTSCAYHSEAKFSGEFIFWRDKLIVLQTLNRQAKIFLRLFLKLWKDKNRSLRSHEFLELRPEEWIYSMKDWRCPQGMLDVKQNKVLRLKILSTSLDSLSVTSLCYHQQAIKLLSNGEHLVLIYYIATYLFQWQWKHPQNFAIFSPHCSPVLLVKLQLKGHK